MTDWTDSLDFKERTDLVYSIKCYLEKYSNIFTKVILFRTTTRGS